MTQDPSSSAASEDEATTTSPSAPPVGGDPATGPVAGLPASSRPAATSVLDHPPDDRDLAERLRRPGLARSTRVLLLLVGAVVLFGVGGLVGRATAPTTGPGSVAPLVGTLESVDAARGFPVITLRGPDGTLTALRTSGATVVAVPRGTPADLRAGQRVTVAGEREADGAVTVTRVDLTPVGG